ncbi:PEP-CTERM sorting domain-containing protein [Sphingomonas sp.]|uniref:PEP-CTERM sorting domain-containing protein n=1 Tax=Sphingomonas sp. TaxID=28214 RepID=UPI0028A9AEBB|nr:PEP-CTERM sorting domain-containing protein [Sphingomonas sp.]
MRRTMFALALAASMPLPAVAQPVTLHITADNFFWYIPNSDAPAFDHADLRLTIDFDRTSAAFDRTQQGLTVHAFNIPYEVWYSWDGASLSIGRYPVDYGGCEIVAQSFCTMIDHPFSAAPTAPFFFYADGKGDWTAANVAVTATSAVPEPTAWASLITGMAALSTALRYRRRRQMPAPI